MVGYCPSCGRVVVVPDGAKELQCATCGYDGKPEDFKPEEDDDEEEGG